MSNYENMILYQALYHLNQKIENSINDIEIKESLPLQLNICGGFALMLHNIRNDPNNRTDIDYIGPALSPNIQNLIYEIGQELDLPKNWLNNDVLLSDSTLEDFEKTTGELKFQNVIQFSQIHISIPSKEDLLRMKVIAIDTSLMGMELGGDFSRLKDFEDVRLLMEDLQFDINDIEMKMDEYIQDPLTLDLIDFYFDHQNISTYENKTYAELEQYVYEQNALFLAELEL